LIWRACAVEFPAGAPLAEGALPNTASFRSTSKGRSRCPAFGPWMTNGRCVQGTVWVLLPTDFVAVEGISPGGQVVAGGAVRIPGLVRSPREGCQHSKQCGHLATLGDMGSFDLNSWAFPGCHIVSRYVAALGAFRRSVDAEGKSLYFLYAFWSRKCATGRVPFSRVWSGEVAGLVPALRGGSCTTVGEGHWPRDPSTRFDARRRLTGSG
jgi:hypothetical protein